MKEIVEVFWGGAGRGIGKGSGIAAAAEDDPMVGGKLPAGAGDLGGAGRGVQVQDDAGRGEARGREGIRVSGADAALNQDGGKGTGVGLGFERADDFAQGPGGWNGLILGTIGVEEEIAEPVVADGDDGGGAVGSRDGGIGAAAEGGDVEIEGPGDFEQARDVAGSPGGGRFRPIISIQ
jgi:hypothetical protein